MTNRPQLKQEIRRLTSVGGGNFENIDKETVLRLASQPVAPAREILHWTR